MVLGDGVLVVDRVDQALVCRVQQGHARSLVDAAALGLDDPVLDLVGHAQAVAAADGVRLHHQVDGGGELLAVDRHRAALFEADRHVLGEDLDVGVPEPHPHDRLDGLDAGVQVLQGLGLVGGAPDVGVGGVRLLRAVAVGQVVGEEPLRHFLAAAEFGHEVRVQPGLVDPQVRVGEQAVAVEPLDVVALEGGAVAPDLYVVLEHRPDQERTGDGAAERRGVEVGAPARADVEGTAGECGQALLDQRLAAVDQPRDLGAVGLCAAGHRVDVGLVVLADVGGVRARDGALVAHPGNRDRRVEAARERDADALADGEGGEDLGHGKTMP